MISAIIAFDDITSTFIHLIKLMFMKINLNYHFDNTSRFSHQKKKITKAISKPFFNVFDYLSTRRVEFKFIIISSMMFAFNITSSTFAIKQNDVLFVFFDNVKSA